MSQYSSSAASSINIADIVRGIWRRKLMVLLLTALTFALSFGYVMTARPRYTTEAQVIVERLETPYDRIQQAQPGEFPAIDDREVLSQISVISSRDLADRVIEALRLSERAEFDPLRSGLGIAKRALLSLGFGDDPRIQSPLQRAKARYYDMLNVYQIPASNVIAVRFSADDPETAAEVANTLAETYVVATREAQSLPTNRARDWLGEQIEGLRKKVVNAEVAAEEFRAKAGLIKGTTVTLGTQELSELNTQIILAETQRTETRAKADSIRKLLASKGTVDSSSDVLGSPLIQRLREQQAQVARSAAELSVTYLPGHPKMVGANRQLVDTNRQIRAEALKIVEGLEDQAEIAATRVESLRSQLDELKSRASESSLDDVKLRALEREAAANRELLEGLLNRYSDASVRRELSSQPGKARMIQRAGVPAVPSFPKTGPTVVLASAAGLALGLGLAFMLEVMAAASRLAAPAMPAPAPVPAAEAPVAARPRKEPELARPAPPVVPAPDPTAAALAKTLGAAKPEPRREPAAEAAAAPAPVAVVAPAPVLAQAAPAPAAHSAPPLCDLPRARDINTAVSYALQFASNAPGHYAPAVQKLSSWIDTAAQEHGVQRFAICAFDGASLDSCAVTATLARLQAQRGVSVIAVDATLGPSPLDAIFGSTGGPGLADLLAGRVNFNEAIARDAVTGAHFLRAGLDRSAAQAFLGSERMNMVLDALANVYQIVLVRAAGIPVARKCHGALVLAGRSHLVSASRAIHDLKEAGLRTVQVARIVSPTAMAAPRVA